MDKQHEWLAGFPPILRSKREQSAFTPAELADQVGVAPEAVESWEEGTSLPSLPEFFRLAELFGWPIPQAIVQEGLAD